MNKILFPLTAVALCFTAHQVMAATATSTNATAKAKIIAPLTITAQTGTGNDLNFGTILSGSNTVTVSAAGVRSDTSGGALLVTDSDNAPSAGKFSATTSNEISGTLILPSSAITVSNGTETMTVSNFTSNFGDGAQTISTSGKNFSVGADLAVGASQATGNYTGTYTVQISY